MNVLLVQSYLGRKEADGTVFPLGLCYIASSLDNHNVEIFDPNTSQRPYDDLSAKVSDGSPDVVGISLRNIDTTQRRDIFYYYKTLRPTIQLIKKIDPSITVVLGGAGFSMFAETIMRRIPEADFGIYLEGEESFRELLDHLDKPASVKGVYFRNNGSVHFSGQRPLPDFNNISIPRRDWLDLTKYIDTKNNTIGIQSKRGCVLSCAYCSYPFLNGKKLRLRNPKHVADEVEYLMQQYNLKKFMFVDSIFNIPVGHAESICREFINRNLKIEWGAWIDIRHLSEDFVRLCKKAGCRELGCSPDAVTGPALSALNKANRMKDILNSIKIIRKVKGIKIGYNFFIVPPRQTFFGYVKTLFLYFVIPLRLMGSAGVMLGWIRIEPHTKLYDMAIQEGVIQHTTDLLPNSEHSIQRLFYTKSTYRLMDGLAHLILYITEDILKPFLRVFRHPLKVLLRKA